MPRANAATAPSQCAQNLSVLNPAPHTSQNRDVHASQRQVAVLPHPAVRSVPRLRAPQSASRGPNFVSPSESASHAIAASRYVAHTAATPVRNPLPEGAALAALWLSTAPPAVSPVTNLDSLQLVHYCATLPIAAPSPLSDRKQATRS